MSNNKKSITPLGLIVATLIICLLASLALPRLRESSRGEEASGSPRVLATFESAVSAAVGGRCYVPVVCTPLGVQGLIAA